MSCADRAHGDGAQECPSLTSLDVQQNTLSAAGAGCLVSAPRHLRSTFALFGPDAEHQADAPCTGLENLNLRWNFIASSVTCCPFFLRDVQSWSGICRFQGVLVAMSSTERP